MKRRERKKIITKNTLEKRIRRQLTMFIAFFQVASNDFKNVPSACNAKSSSGVHDPLPLTTTGHNTFLQ